MLIMARLFPLLGGMMTINRARQILGRKYNHLTDDQIQVYINQLKSFVILAIDQIKKNYSLPKEKYEGSHLS